MPLSTPVLPALDALRAQQSEASHDTLRRLRGRRVGLLTNHTGRTQDGIATLDVLRALDVHIVALFSPEHGPQGIREGHIESDETREGLPIFSLYGETRCPTPEMLAHIEVLVCDIQDVGARFYTYASTLALCLEVCLPRDIMVVVLDRPNPLGGEVAGPMVDEAVRSFVGHVRVPVQHGLTMGELALLHARDEALNTDGLHVIPCAGWHRALRWPQTGLVWVAPSPNLPDFRACAWYPSLCLAEFSNVAVGRGTEAPFQIVGAPWLDAQRVLSEIQRWPASIMHSIRAEAIEFTPTRAIFEGERCQGVRFFAQPDAEPPQPVAVGMALLCTLHSVHPDGFQLDKALSLLGSTAILELLRAGNLENALTQATIDAGTFKVKRRPILLYD